MSKKNSSTKKKAMPDRGRACIHTTSNNTIVTITSVQGDTLTQSSGGRTAKGSRKGLAHAAEQAAIEAGTAAKSRGMSTVSVIINGPGNGREAAVRGLVSAGLEIDFIMDASGDPHGGCRRRRKRRI